MTKVKSVIIRNLKDKDQALLSELKDKLGENSNSKALLKAGHLYLKQQKKIEELAALSREYHRLKDDCNDYFKGLDALDSIKDRIENRVTKNDRAQKYTAAEWYPTSKTVTEILKAQNRTAAEWYPRKR